MSQAIESLNEFEHLVNKISDPDFGDFKRKTGNYISRIAPDLFDNKKAFTVLADLKAELLYGDNLRDTDHVREYVLEKIDDLRSQVN